MPDLQDLIRLVRGPVPEKALPAIWDTFPCHAGAVGIATPGAWLEER